MTNTLKNLISLCALCAILLIGFSACKDQKELATGQPERSFIIGSGGGFTGKYNIYKIHNDGRVDIMDDSLGNYTPLKTLPLDSTNLYFEILDKLELQNFKFNYPDNMTWFIEVNNGVDSNRLNWGDITHPVRPDIHKFFKRVNKSVNTNIR